MKKRLGNSFLLLITVGLLIETKAEAKWNPKKTYQEAAAEVSAAGGQVAEGVKKAPIIGNIILVGSEVVEGAEHIWVVAGETVADARDRAKQGLNDLTHDAYAAYKNVAYTLAVTRQNIAEKAPTLPPLRIQASDINVRISPASLGNISTVMGTSIQGVGSIYWPEMDFPRKIDTNFFKLIEETPAIRQMTAKAAKMGEHISETAKKTGHDVAIKLKSAGNDIKRESLFFYRHHVRECVDRLDRCWFAWDDLKALDNKCKPGIKLIGEKVPSTQADCSAVTCVSCDVSGNCALDCRNIDMSNAGKLETLKASDVQRCSKVHKVIAECKITRAQTSRDSKFSPFQEKITNLTRKNIVIGGSK